MRNIFLLIIWLVPVVASADAARTDSVYRCIDEAIANASVYLSKREARIAGLKRQFDKSRGYAARYAAAFRIYREYKAFVNDSAIAWLGRAERMARSQGDMARSYKYINFAWNCAEKFGTRVRSNQISPVLTSIDSSYQTIMQKQKERLVIMVLVISLFAVSVLVLLIYVNKQRGKLKLTRDELSRKYRQLMKLNKEMQQVNENLDESNRQLTETDRQLHKAIGSLNESNRVKEKYIGLFLRQCSIYIDNMERMRKEVLTMLKNKQHTELMSKMKSHDFRDRQQQELFDIFDTTFIHLFPTFVDDFNKLLRPEERIHLDDTSRLNTDIRIFALIRLGIDDSSKIAEFLHYSVNTIYNYRARIKNGATCGRDEFEKKVKEIGVPQHTQTEGDGKSEAGPAQ